MIKQHNEKQQTKQKKEKEKKKAEEDAMKDDSEDDMKDDEEQEQKENEKKKQKKSRTPRKYEHRLVRFLFSQRIDGHVISESVPRYAVASKPVDKTGNWKFSQLGLTLDFKETDSKFVFYKNNSPRIAIKIDCVEHPRVSSWRNGDTVAFGILDVVPI
jgi:hypothetical protein